MNDGAVSMIAPYGQSPKTASVAVFLEQVTVAVCVSAQPVAQKDGTEKCYGVAPAGKNGKSCDGQYYGVQGTDWRSPPILDNPSSSVTSGGRTFKLFYDGSRLKLVAWRTRRGSYWVSNTLTQSLGKDQMLGIAASPKVATDGTARTGICARRRWASTGTMSQ